MTVAKFSVLRQSGLPTTGGLALNAVSQVESLARVGSRFS